MNPQKAPHAKPLRLALACNQCRKRKVRCDTSQPRCRNCEARDDPCEARDLRRIAGQRSGPRGRVVAGRQSLSPAREAPPSTGTGIHYGHSPPQLPIVRASSASVTPRTNSHHIPSEAWVADSVAVASKPHHRGRVQQGQSEEHISWLARAYQQSMTETTAQTPAGQLSHSSAEQTNSVFSPEEVVNQQDGKFKYIGGSSLQFLFSFVDLHLSRHGFTPIGPLFKNGMANSEEFPMSIFPVLPDLPERCVFMSYLDVYFARLWPFYPIIEREAIEASFDTVCLDHSSQTQDWRSSITLNRVSTYVMIYAIVSIGMRESSHPDVKENERFLLACYGLHGHLTAQPYLPSIQALVLVTLALRGFGKDGQAWHIMGYAIRLAQSLGLHRLGIRRQTADGSRHIERQNDSRERVWWTCYALEKLFQLESGRPSAIDQAYDHLPVNCNITKDLSDTSAATTYFVPWVSLARIIGQIASCLYSHVFDGSNEMLAEVARLDQSLVDWESALPDHLKPCNSFPDHNNDAQILNIFLCQQFYNAQIATLRVALIFPLHSYLAEIKKRSADVPNNVRLLSGATICTHAARSMATQVLQVADAGVRSMLLSGSEVFLAAVVLALAVLRQPGSRLARSDVELLRTATEYAEDFWKENGFPSDFTQICYLLRERVNSAFQNYNNGKRKMYSTPVTQSNADMGRIHSVLVNTEPDWTISPGPAGLETTGEVGTLFDSIGMDHLWTMMDSDFLLEY